MSKLWFSILALKVMAWTSFSQGRLSTIWRLPLGIQWVMLSQAHDWLSLRRLLPYYVNFSLMSSLFNLVFLSSFMLYTYSWLDFLLFCL